MGRFKENACVGCAECIHCGRKQRTQTILVCDKCGAADYKLYKDFNGEELCYECALDKWLDTIMNEYFTIIED